MTPASYLPSKQFSTTVGSIAIALVLILGAQYYTARPSTAPSLAADATGQTDPNWQATLEQVQTEAAVAAPQAPDPDAVNTLKTAAKSGNITDSVARTLFISVSDAEAQGLGSDLPTQDRLIAGAAAQLQLNNGPAYKTSDMSLGAQNNDAIRRWANRVMTSITSRPAANVNDTYVALGRATDNNDKTKLLPLKSIGDAYAAIAEDIVTLDVPPTLAPLALKIANTFAAIAGTYPDLATLGSDPLRALAGLQNFKFYMDEQSRLFTNVAQTLAKDGILFSKDEPGQAWSVYVPTSQ